jgi:hypothetical protein
MSDNKETDPDLITLELTPLTKENYKIFLTPAQIAVIDIDSLPATQKEAAQIQEIMYQNHKTNVETGKRIIIEKYRELISKNGDAKKNELQAKVDSAIREEGHIFSINISDKILETLQRSLEPTAIQGELFPVFTIPKNIELKKEFALNFGGLDRIEQDYKPLLNEKLTGGMTLQQHINKIRGWFNNLHGEDLGNWIKLFSYVKAVKEYSESGEEAVNFREVSTGRYSFSIKQNKAFFSFFIRPDKKTGQFTTKAKTKFLKWLHDNQSTIEFPLIINGKVWNVPMRIYQYAENISDKEIFFTIDTNILESEFKDYVSINIKEIDEISEIWETMAENNRNFKTLSLGNFLDIPLKFLLTLKTIYSREGNYQNGSFGGNSQRLSAESLDSHLGNLLERIQKHLISRDRIKTGKTSHKPREIKNLILETTFTIAVQRKWLLSMPICNDDSMYKFNINTGYFDRRKTARRLNTPKNP